MATNPTTKTRVVVLGASGMLGHKMFEVLSMSENYDVYGTVTSISSFRGLLPKSYSNKINEGVFADKIETVIDVLARLKPNIVINCIGIIKQSNKSHDAQGMILLNALFPHQVASICDELSARLITIATDCVFDGQKGEPYLESDIPTCHDEYGMTKYLGELRSDNNLTLRTSIIGHEMHTHKSLIDWFLYDTKPQIKGYSKAIFSGFPTVILSRLISDKIIPNNELKGLLHISVDPISKYDLLKKVAKMYKKDVEIVPDQTLSINRSLNSDIIRRLIGYTPPSWDELVETMYNDYIKSTYYQSIRKI